jgi:hypothetical protein
MSYIALRKDLQTIQVIKISGPGGIRTRDLQLRRLPPYPGSATGPIYQRQETNMFIKT